jgi:hypothetical protein
MADEEVQVNEEPSAEEQQVQDREAIEAEARSSGWKPKEDWKGDTSRWTDAPEWVEHANKVLPIVRGKLAETREERDKLYAKVTDLTSRFDKLAESTKKVGELAYNRALKEIQERRTKAVEEGDGEAFEKAEGEIAALEKPVDIPVAPEPEPVHQAAEAIAAVKVQQGTTLTGEAFFNAVKSDVMAAYPQSKYFSNPNRTGANEVEAGSGSSRNRSAKKGYNDLPPEAKAACDRFVADGTCKDRDAYLATYEFDED